jgi:hypothetical protein
MAWTQQNIDALKAAIATGLLEAEIRQGDVTQRMRYQSFSQMQAALAQMEAEVNASSQPSAFSFPAYSRD